MAPHRKHLEIFPLFLQKNNQKLQFPTSKSRNQENAHFLCMRNFGRIEKFFGKRFCYLPPHGAVSVAVQSFRFNFGTAFVQFCFSG